MKEGFDFVPGQPGQIWHAQNDEVDRYLLERLAGAAEPATGSGTKPE